MDFALRLGRRLSRCGGREARSAGRDECAANFRRHEQSKWYVDTRPISERIAARQAGLGWLAKNTLLIHPELGSWLFLGVILTSLEFAPTETTAPLSNRETSQQVAAGPPADLCGQCSLCIEACPTGAIVEPYVLDARRCISYLTIELRGSIPENLRASMGRQVFGCDICQDVCPWNRQAPVTRESRFEPRENQFAPELERLAALSEEEFRQVARGTPLKRAKWRGLIRNACVALGNSGLKPPSPAHSRATVLLARLAAAPDADGGGPCEMGAFETATTRLAKHHCTSPRMESPANLHTGLARGRRECASRSSHRH